MPIFTFVCWSAPQASCGRVPKTVGTAGDPRHLVVGIVEKKGRYHDDPRRACRRFRDMTSIKQTLLHVSNFGEQSLRIKLGVR